MTKTRGDCSAKATAEKGGTFAFFGAIGGSIIGGGLGFFGGPPGVVAGITGGAELGAIAGGALGAGTHQVTCRRKKRG